MIFGGALKVNGNVNAQHTGELGNLFVAHGSYINELIKGGFNASANGVFNVGAKRECKQLELRLVVLLEKLGHENACCVAVKICREIPKPNLGFGRMTLNWAKGVIDWKLSRPSFRGLHLQFC